MLPTFLQEPTTMFEIGKSRTEELLALSQKRNLRLQAERDDAEQEKADRKVRLRALRLAKAASDKEDKG